MSFVRVIVAYLAAVLVMTVLGTIAQSLFNLAALAAVGAELGLAHAVSMLAFDLAGLGPLYGPIIAIGFAIALPAAALAGRLLKTPRLITFAAAGLICLVVMLLAMEEVFFGVQVIAGARSLAGFIVQTLIGALAAATFAALTPAPKRGQGRRGEV